MRTYRVTGQHAIQVASGYYVPGAANVVLTDDEALNLTRGGAVQADEPPAPVRDQKKSAGLPSERGKVVAGDSRTNED